ncbi:MAG: hypothetical protein GTN80_07710 [Nitrososphaeria archaeon]|nr:hypothetical protein [Nitrososphaeria archaeon]NIN52951.1 hypothetical protein [Nitrososphaeria archaeon]NIQ33510.1 hypothetical protein [Nitrososphaeria archaeon]
MEKYYGCAQTTLAAAADTLNMEADDVFKALIGISGGVGGMGLGECGGMCGAAAAISFRFGHNPKEFAQKPETRFKIYDLVEKVCKKFLEEYGSLICRDIQMKLFGMAFNLRDPKIYEEFTRIRSKEDPCPKVTGKAAGWAVEAILEAEEKNE